MGLFDFARGAGDKLFGGDDLDEKQINDHIKSLGLALNPFSAIVSNAKEGVVSLVGYARTLADKEKAILAAGNIKGVEKVEDRLKIGKPDWMQDQDAAAAEPQAADAEQVGEPTDEEAPPARFYTVVSGDTLGKIAKEMYGNAGKYTVIFEANKPMLSDPNKIYPGQVLRIPPLDD